MSYHNFTCVSEISLLGKIIKITLKNTWLIFKLNRMLKTMLLLLLKNTQQVLSIDRINIFPYFFVNWKETFLLWEFPHKNP